MDEPMGTETDCLARLRLYVCRIGFAVCCGRGMFARHLFRRLRSAGCRQYHRAGGGQSVVGDHCAERTHDRLSDCRTDFPECLVVARRTARYTFAAWTGSWRGLLLLYALLTVVGGIWLQAVAVPEPDVRTDAVRFADCFRLLRNRTVLLCTGGVACFIAADIGINFVAVRLIDSPMSMLTSTGFTPAASSEHWSVHGC